MSHLLMLDDDSRLAEMVTSYLAPHGYSFVLSESINDAKAIIGRDGANAFACVILDVMLPDGDGFDFLRWLRQKHAIAVLMLTARGVAMDRVVGLELGADDYLPKPFEPRELPAHGTSICAACRARRKRGSRDVTGAIDANREG